MLKIESLTIHYGTAQVVDHVSLEVAPGEVVALIGPNGAGKTSLVRGISGVTEVSSGSVSFNGTELTRLPPPQRARIMAVVPQVSYLGGAFTVEQVVMMGRTAYMSWTGKPSKEDQHEVAKAMENTKTTSLAKRRIAELSGGEQQRVMLARALAQNTPLLVLDEPTNHLDLQHQGTLLSLVREQAMKSNLAVLMVLHDLNLVSLFADQAALMVSGQLAAFGPPADVLSVETISQAYQADVEVIRHPENNTPIILQKTNQL
jgi:iron complex transport system ATP-binding protein